jgi:hypothetical protein
MLPSDFDSERRFHEVWDAVEIVRPVSYSLFTFGSSELPYYLVCPPGRGQPLASVRKGQVNIDRPLILTPDNLHPEFRDFFEDATDEGIIDFLLARTASFSNLKLTNRSGETKLVSDSVEEIVSRLNRQLDNEEEDRVAILTAPSTLAGVAVLKYATERVLSSTPDNVQELRERGFLP